MHPVCHECTQSRLPGWLTNSAVVQVQILHLKITRVRTSPLLFKSKCKGAKKVKVNLVDKLVPVADL